MIDTKNMSYQLVSFNFDLWFWVSLVVFICLLVAAVLLTNRLLLKKRHWLRLGLFVIEAMILTLTWIKLEVKPRITYAQISEFEVIEVDNDLVMLSFVTAKSELINLVQKVNFFTFKQIMPTNTFQSQNRHNFLVDIKQKKTKIFFEINQQKYYVNWSPLILKY